jgi:hypothetical protein
MMQLRDSLTGCIGCGWLLRRLRTTPLSRKLQAVTLPSTIQ